MTPAPNPFTDFLQRQPILMLDGGFATELEARGHDLAHPLWSARMLLEAPNEITAVHRAFLEAGADCIASCSYQATVQGFTREGLTRAEALEALDRSVQLAVDARDAFVLESDDPARIRPLVAASVGPYGAFLADGSEYSGDYDLDEDGLYDFHDERFRRFAAGPADLIGCETIPSLPEARALARLLDDVDRDGWISFSCRDGRRLHDGTPVEEAVAAVHVARGLAGIGVNCVAPDQVPELVRRIVHTTGLPVLAYPNSGESWNAQEKRWTGNAYRAWEDGPSTWIAAGARILGGCCRVGPEVIARLRSRFVEAI